MKIKMKQHHEMLKAHLEFVTKNLKLAIYIYTQIHICINDIIHNTLKCYIS